MGANTPRLVTVDLSAAITSEVATLARRYGAPRVVDSPIDDSFDDPIRKPDRFGEVCMVVRRPNGRLLLSIKTFYPRGAYRLPTGGIHHGERIYDALVREAHEETGLDVEVERFLAHIRYQPAGRPEGGPLFHTFAFLLGERGGELGAIDTTEQIEGWREVEPRALPDVAAFLDDLRSSGSVAIGGDWRAWGRFRAVVHRAVHAELAG